MPIDDERAAPARTIAAMPKLATAPARNPGAADAVRRVRVAEPPRRDVRVQDREVGGMEHAVAHAHHSRDREQPADPGRPAKRAACRRPAAPAAEQHGSRTEPVDVEAGGELRQARGRVERRRPARRAASTTRRTRRAAAETAAAARAGRRCDIPCASPTSPMTRASRRNESAGVASKACKDGARATDEPARGVPSDYTKPRARSTPWRTR